LFFKLKISYIIEIFRKVNYIKEKGGGQNGLMGGQNDLLPFMRAFSTS